MANDDRNSFGLPPDPVTGSKIERARPWSAWAEQGKVRLLRGEWNRQFKSWASKFPSGKRDTIDACFPADTLVATPHGDIPIQFLSWGSEVITPIGIRKIKNLYVYHESDEYTHWTDKMDEVLKLREAWDSIPKKYRKHVLFLIERGKHLAEMKQAEIDAGEAL